MFLGRDSSKYGLKEGSSQYELGLEGGSILASPFMRRRSLFDFGDVMNPGHDLPAKRTRQTREANQ